MKFGKMKSHRRNRLARILCILLGSGGALTLGMMALEENINLFYSPQQIVSGAAPLGQTIRAGGMVKAGSVNRSATDLKVEFIVSDLGASEVTIHFEGILPDLFREGQGIIALGILNAEGIFEAEEVLAKHDEQYMPPEISQTLALAEKNYGKQPRHPPTKEAIKAAKR